MALDEGRGVRETARLLEVSAAKVSEVRQMMSDGGPRSNALHYRSHGALPWLRAYGWTHGVCLEAMERPLHVPVDQRLRAVTQREEMLQRSQKVLDNHRNYEKMIAKSY
jgi:hypothetical protein